MKINEKFGKLATGEQVQKTAAALLGNGFKAEVVGGADEAKKRILEIIPRQAEVMTMTSVTLDTLGLDKELNDESKYHALRPKLLKMDRNTQGREM